MQIPLLAWILQGIPEQIAVLTLSFVIAKIPLSKKKIIIGGLILAILVYLIRLLPITYGLHTIFSFTFIFLYLYLIGKASIPLSLLSALSSYFLLGLVETICVNIAVALFGISTATILTNTTIRILATLPQVFILFLIAFITSKLITKKVKNYEYNKTE